MAESILVTPEDLRSKASDIDTKASEYMGHYESLLADVESLTSTDYKGPEGTAFRNQIEGFREDFLRMKSLMEEYAAFMRTAATNYENQQNAAINTIQGLQN